MRTLTTAMMEEITGAAERIITKWGPSNAAVLFHGSSGDDSTAFLSAVGELKHAMNTLHSRALSGAHQLHHANKLLETAMTRLQNELQRILETHGSAVSSIASYHSTTDETSSDNTSDDANEEAKVMPTSSMENLKSIVGCMVACGYTKECVRVYTTARRAVVEDALRRLGMVKLRPSQVQKLEWDVEERLIRIWVAGARPAVRTLFSGESFLCDYVFGSLKETVFAEVARDPAVQFFRFPEMASAKTKKTPEKIFHFLDMYDTISELYPEIESIFSGQATANVASQARGSLAKLGEFVRGSFGEFESAIEKDMPKGTVPGGGLHPLTRYVMNYLGLLADYGEILGEILDDHPLKPLAEPFLKLLSPVTTAPSSPIHGEEPEDLPAPPPPVVSSRVAWLILLLLCKLDGKAEIYREPPLSYLFLANNMRYVVHKVRTTNLRRLLGDEWVETHGEKARAFARSYERLGWRKVVEAIPSKPVGVVEATERMAEFEAAFEEAYRKHSGWVVKDRWMRDELKVSIAGKVMAPYREFYQRYLELMRKEKDLAGVAMVRFTPEDIGNYLSDLFYGAPAASPSGSSRSSGSGSSYGSKSGSGSSKTGAWKSA